jgi:Acyl-CoA reductase (LuxC)
MAFNIPLIIRGKVIQDADIEFKGRSNGVSFTTPDIRKYLPQLPLARPADLAELHALKFEETLDYLEELGTKFDLKKNAYLQEALELSALSSGLSREVVHHFYSTMGHTYNRDFIREHAENCIGVKYLEGWVPRKMASGCVCNVRAFGVRSLHVLAGNVPAPSSLGVIRNAITHSDAIFKMPSNDPLTAAAIARTMIDMAPDHPITRHLSIAYWKGGDTTVEEYLYRPDRIEKIVAWGGAASMTSIKKYMQPGMDLVSMDPKLSSAIIGREAFADEVTMRDVAERLALDVGYLNQQACSAARVVYIQTGTDKAGLEKACRFGKRVFEAIQGLPATASGPAPHLGRELEEEVQSLKIMSDEHTVFGGGKEGAVIVSKNAEPVDFAPLLNDRFANLVPFDNLETPIKSVNSYTQTIGIYPDSLKEKIRDQLVFQGAQRLTTLGYMMKAAMAGPHDGIEPVRRMAKWVSDETNDPTLVSLLARTTFNDAINGVRVD